MIARIDTLVERTAQDVLAQTGKDPKFEEYNKVAKYISRCLDHFGVERDKSACIESMNIFYALIKRVDDEFDIEGRQRPDLGEILRGQAHSLPDDSSILMKALRQRTYSNLERVSSVWEELLYAGYHERDAYTMKDYIERRRASGRATAKATCEVLRPHVTKLPKKFTTFLGRAGEATTVFDTAIDLKQDSANGELPFKPSQIDRVRLYAEALKGGIGLVVRYPFIAKDTKRVISWWMKKSK